MSGVVAKSLPAPSPAPSNAGVALRRHLLWLVAGVLIPMVIFAAAVTHTLALRQREAQESNLQTSARDLALVIDGELRRTVFALEVIGKSATLAKGDLDAFRDELDRVLQVNDLPSPGTDANSPWAALVLFDARAHMLINTRYDKGVELPNVGESDSHRRVIETRKFDVGALPPSRIDSFPVRIPIILNGDVRYVLTAWVKTDSLDRLIRSDRRANAADAIRTLVDKRGTIVARTRDSDRYLGQPASDPFRQNTATNPEGFFPSTSPEGASAYVAYARSTVSGWTCAVIVPGEVLDGPVRRSAFWVYGVGLTMVILSVVAAYLMSRRIASGIESVTIAADALSRGEVPCVEASPVREVARLGEALGRSAQLLALRETERMEHLERAESARRESEAASRAKDEFLAMLGHELRNPLAPVRNGVYLLSRYLGSDEQAASVLEVMERQVVHMTRMIDDLLDASRVARGKLLLELQPLDLDALVAETVADFRPQFTDATKTLTLRRATESIYIEGDRTRIAQCVGNLLHNALKFTPPNSEIRVNLRADPTDAIIEVIDQGVGIDADLLPRLFQPFSQGRQSLSRSGGGGSGHGGLGLGLALVRGLIELHGGRVEARSDGPDRGATLTLRIPKLVGIRHPANGVVEVTGPSHRRAPIPTGIKVLVIEDMHDSARTMKLLLSAEGHDVRTAETGTEGLHTATDFRPDVVLCDIGLPDIDGYEVCRLMKQRLPNTRLVALTGYGQAEDIARAKDAGFDLHLVKPVDLEHLRSAIRGSPFRTTSD